MPATASSRRRPAQTPMTISAHSGNALSVVPTSVVLVDCEADVVTRPTDAVLASTVRPSALELTDAIALRSALANEFASTAPDETAAWKLTTTLP